MYQIEMKKHKKIIVWGAKPDTGHTHQFVNSAFYNASKFLGLNAYWLDNRDNMPDDFFDDAIIITEQWLVFPNGLSVTSNKLPLRKSSTYLVHYVGNKGVTADGNPSVDMYLDKVGRLIDHRLACSWGVNGVEDKNYAYEFNKSQCEELGGGSGYYQKGDKYDFFYSFWGTDLLPTEINFNDRFIPFKEPKYAFFGGTITNGWGNPEDGNIDYIKPFAEECQKEGIPFIWNDTQKNPLTPMQLKQASSESYLPIDVRPKNHLVNNYVSCRTIKNCSYGQLVITNSKAIQEFFGGEVAYSENTTELFHIAKEMQDNPKTKDMIWCQMQMVKEKHTYVSRIIDIVNIAER
jgi:hypothetical protein